MCRVSGFCFNWLSTLQPSMSGRKTSSDTAFGLNSVAKRQRLGATLRDQHLEAVVVRQVHEDARIVRIVLDDKQHGFTRIEIVAIVGDGFDRALRDAQLLCFERYDFATRLHFARRRQRARCSSAAGTA